jgi:hypothetical protein
MLMGLVQPWLTRAQLVATEESLEVRQTAISVKIKFFFYNLLKILKDSN